MARVTPSSPSLNVTSEMALRWSLGRKRDTASSAIVVSMADATIIINIALFINYNIF